MDVFRGKPAAVAGVLAIIAAVVSLVFAVEVKIALIIAAPLCAVFCLALVFMKIISPYRFFTICVCVAIFCGVLWSGYLFYDVECESARNYCGDDKRVVATVLERKKSTNYLTIYTVNVSEVDGERCDIKAELICEYVSDLQAGYRFVVTNASVGHAFASEMSANYLISSEILLEIITTDIDRCSIYAEDRYTPEIYLKRCNTLLSTRLISGIDGEAGRLASAMLLGTRESLSPSAERDFKRAGMSHLLAVSGLHVSIVTSIAGVVLLKLRIRKQLRYIFLAVFVLCYLAILGFPVSAVRSVIMMFIMFVAFFGGTSSDAISSLGLAASVILFISPAAVLDGSFILSFCATFGIVSFLPLFNDIVEKIGISIIEKINSRKEKRSKKNIRLFISDIVIKIMRTPISAVLSMFSALSLTLLASALINKDISLVSIPSNLIGSVLASPLLFLSLLYLPLGSVPVISEYIELGIEKVAGIMLDLAYEFGDMNNALVSLSSEKSLAIIAAFTFLIFLLMIVRFKHKAWAMFVPCIYPVVLFLVVMTVNSTFSDTIDMTVVSTGKDENVLLMQNSNAVICDFSDGSFSRLRSVADIAEENGAVEYEAMILTHYHTKHTYSVERFMNEEKVRRLWLPMPDNMEDVEIMRKLCESASREGCECAVYNAGEKITVFGEMYLTYSGIQRIKRSEHPTFYLNVEREDTSVLYIGESAWEIDADIKNALSYVAAKSDIILFGSHGPVIKTPVDIKFEECSEVVIFDTVFLEYIAHPDSICYEAIRGSNGVISPEIWKIVFQERRGNS